MYVKCVQFLNLRHELQYTCSAFPNKTKNFNILYIKPSNLSTNFFKHVFSTEIKITIHTKISKCIL